MFFYWHISHKKRAGYGEIAVDSLDFYIGREIPKYTLLDDTFEHESTTYYVTAVAEAEGYYFNFLVRAEGPSIEHIHLPLPEEKLAGMAALPHLPKLKPAVIRELTPALLTAITKLHRTYWL